MSERFNIKDILVESGKPLEYRFNPAKDITPEQRVKIVELCDRSAASNKWLDFLLHVSQAKLLNVQIPITPEQESGLKKIIFPGFGSDPEGVISMVARSKIVGKDIWRDEFSVKDVTGEMDWAAQEGEWDTFATFAFYARICGFPVTVSAEQARNIHQVTQDHFQREEEGMGVGELLAYQRVLGLPLHLTNEQRVLLAEDREDFWEMGGWTYFLECAANEAIVSASKVTVPPGGGLELEFKDEDQHTDATPTLPHSRNF